MKRTVLLLLLWASGLAAFAQPKAFDISVGGGFYSTPSRRPVTGGGSFHGDFEYHHAKRWAFSAGIITTQYFYRQEGSSSSTLSGIPINRASEFQSNFLVKYKVVNLDVVTFQVGLGAGLITMGKEVEINYASGTISPLFTSSTDLGFPLSVEAYVKLTKHFLVGAKAGSFFFPDYPIVGNNLSLQVRYRL